MTSYIVYFFNTPSVQLHNNLRCASESTKKFPDFYDVSFVGVLSNKISRFNIVYIMY